MGVLKLTELNVKSGWQEESGYTHVISISLLMYLRKSTGDPQKQRRPVIEGSFQYVYSTQTRFEIALKK